MEGGRCEGEQDRAQQGDALDEAGGGVGAGEDGLEDAGEVEGVERGGEGGGDDGARVGEVLLGCGEFSGRAELVGCELCVVT